MTKVAAKAKEAVSSQLSARLGRKGWCGIVVRLWFGGNFWRTVMDSVTGEGQGCLENTQGQCYFLWRVLEVKVRYPQPEENILQTPT